MKLGIDPGHGGYDPGAIGPGGTHEADMTLDISIRLADFLIKQGIEIVLDRHNDQPGWTHDNEFTTRCKILNDAKVDFVLSIHTNSAADKRAHGTETLYRNSGQDLAASIQAQIVKDFGLTDRGTKQRMDLAILHRTNAPAALVETAFISNPGEEKMLLDPAFRQRMAESIGRGFIKYIGWGEKKVADENKPQNPFEWGRKFIEILKEKGDIDGDHEPDAPVTWAEFAAYQFKQKGYI